MTIWIIEDEAAAAQRLEKMLLELDPGIHISAVLDSVEATLSAAQRQPLPDLLFMDIHLADGSSFEIFNRLQIDKPVVFTTAYDQYAVQAFEVHAIDYLLKPLKRPALERALEKYRRLAPQPAIDYRELARAMQREISGHRFLVRLGHQIRIVSLEDAAYFYTEDKITFVMTWEGKRYPLEISLEKLEELVEGLPFFRINRQFIIHLTAIPHLI